MFGGGAIQLLIMLDVLTAVHEESARPDLGEQQSTMAHDANRICCLIEARSWSQ